ncbi:MAG: type II secretion system F family protein [Cellvibrionaceae bacterium]
MMNLTLVFVFVFASVALLAFAVLVVGNSVRQKLETDMSEEANMNLADMFMFVDGEQLARYYTIALVVVPVVTLVFTWDFLSVVIAVVLMALLPRVFYTQVREKRLKAFEGQLPDAFMSLSSSLQAGSSLMGAVESLVHDQPAPLNQEFALLLRKVKLGVNFDVALVEMENRLPSQDFRVALSAIRISREVGGNLTEVMESLAATLRQKAAMEGKIIALTSQGKMQGYVMSGLPILLAGVLNAIEPEAMSKLYNTPMGYGFLLVIAIMLSLGFMIIRSITKIDV